MGSKDHPKDSQPGYRVPKDRKGKPIVTNGPYTWGNGPQPYGLLKRIAMKLKGR